MSRTDATVILPGQWIGMLGSGQLGQMFTLAAKAMGYRVFVLASDEDDPAAQVADRAIGAAYDDLDAVGEVARAVDVVTVEFENIPGPTLETAQRFAPARPGPHALHVTQHRLREKQFLNAAGVPVAPFAEVTDAESLSRAVATIGVPAVLKTTAWGYDGKGQARVESAATAAAAWESLGRPHAVLESFVDFACEISVVIARGLDGRSVTYGPMLNGHADHILDVSVFPSGVAGSVAREAIQIAETVAEQLDYIGVLCVEFFVTQEEGVLANEIAPRPHNSGHLTIDGHMTSQFEQQVRAICGLPLGSVAPKAPACAMANLLGDLWTPGQPHWDNALRDPLVKLYLYGKSEARVGRKMGHLTVTGSDAGTVEAAVRRARARLGR